MSTEYCFNQQYIVQTNMTKDNEETYTYIEDVFSDDDNDEVKWDFESC